MNKTKGAPFENKNQIHQRAAFLLNNGKVIATKGVQTIIMSKNHQAPQASQNAPKMDLAVFIPALLNKVE